jgi:hypothetical protein
MKTRALLNTNIYNRLADDDCSLAVHGGTAPNEAALSPIEDLKSRQVEVGQVKSGIIDF